MSDVPATRPKLERDYVVLLGPKRRKFDGQITRNVELQPCGCWAGEVYRVVQAPEGVKVVDEHGRPQTVRKGWCQETRQCPTHAAVVVVAQLEIASRLAQSGQLLEGQRGNVPPVRISEETYFAKLGDGAKRLWADKQNVLARAKALDDEIKALGTIESKLLGPKDKL